jgi:capsule polysaccharide export protein KpsE/RkpR
LKTLFPERGLAAYERSYRQGQYQRCLEQSEALIQQHPGSAGYDRALWYAGLSLVQLDPPAENYSRAMVYFSKLLQQCPESGFAGAAAAWVKVLSGIARNRQELQQLQAQLSQCSRASDEQASQAARLKAETGRLKKELELLKRVDLQLQQQKKDMHNAGKP